MPRESAETALWASHPELQHADDAPLPPALLEPSVAALFAAPVPPVIKVVRARSPDALHAAADEMLVDPTWKKRAKSVKKDNARQRRLDNQSA